ncbi:DNA-directed DNA polymerase [Macleaya cordata]|uniref:DNA-directed DNA polymerase n=1 Tax=Macleaya cordata TaxID=56857 RepID=A0A200QJI4_MACCD|nr:DNA-directed DNA polymerase [Macleaya cordata]
MGIKSLISLQMIPWCFPSLIWSHISCVHLRPEPAAGTIKLIKSDGIVRIYHQPINASDLMMEFPKHLVNILADMELWGIGVDMEGCLRARQMLGKKLKELETEAYRLAGKTFSLYKAADIANILYGHLKLPIPEGQSKGKQHPSTDKHSLDLLRHQHPIVSVIKEHRTLAKLLNCTLGSICSLARLSMRSQNVLSMRLKASLKDKNRSDLDADRHVINAHDFFMPTQDNWLLLTADYSQIELQLMVHFSKDSSLIQFLSKPNGDVFTMIAARWSGQLESTVSSQERDQTKRLVYGILYGMGPKNLAEQLDCSSDEAAEKIQSFKSSFPGVASWLHEAVESCRQKGYITTLKGRKRFLSKIKLGNSKEQGKAQRQAVNSICQGSAADIIKIAMITIHSVIAEGCLIPDSASKFAAQFPMLKGHCRLVLLVHDELVLEVDPFCPTGSWIIAKREHGKCCVASGSGEAVRVLMSRMYFLYRGKPPVNERIREVVLDVNTSAKVLELHFLPNFYTSLKSHFQR